MCQCWIALRCLSLQVTQNARSQAVLTNYSGFDYICSDSAAHRRSNKTFLSSLISPHCFVWGCPARSSRHWGKAGCQTHSPMFPPIMSGWREVCPGAASPMPDVCSTAGWRCREARSTYSKPAGSSCSSQKQRHCTRGRATLSFPKRFKPRLHPQPLPGCCTQPG